MSAMNWNAPVVNATDCFFTEESYTKYSIDWTYKQYLVAKDKQLWGPKEDATKVTTTLDAPTSDDVQNDVKKETPNSGQVVDPNLDITTEIREVTPEEEIDNSIAVDAVASSSTNANIQEQQKPPAGETPYKFRPRFPYPRPSWLNHDEQVKYLDLSEKYTEYVPVKATPEETREINLLKDLQLRVSMEQDEFMAYLESVASKSGKDYEHMHPEIKRYMQEFLEHERQRVKSYPRNYKQLDTVPLMPPKVPQMIPFQHEQTLLEIGLVPKIILPKFDRSERPKAPTDYNKISANYPTNGIGQKGILQNRTCSADRNAEKLAPKYGSDIVISSSGLKCLVDNAPPHYHRQWEIPVEVREEDITLENGEKTKKNIVYVDKPFAQKQLNKREMNTWLYKFSLYSHLLHPKHNNSRKFGKDAKPMPVDSGDIPKEKAPHAKKRASGLTEREPDMFKSTMDVTSLETFGVKEDSSTPSKKKKTGDDVTKEILANLTESLKKVKQTTSADVENKEFVIKATPCVGEPATDASTKTNEDPVKPTSNTDEGEVKPASNTSTKTDEDEVKPASNTSAKSDEDSVKSGTAIKTDEDTADVRSPGPMTRTRSSRASSASTVSPPARQQGSPRSTRSQGSSLSQGSPRPHDSPRSLRSSRGPSSRSSSRVPSAEMTSDDDSDDQKMTIDVEFEEEVEKSPPPKRRRGRPRKSVDTETVKPIPGPSTRSRSQSSETPESGRVTRSGRAFNTEQSVVRGTHSQEKIESITETDEVEEKDGGTPSRESGAKSDNLDPHEARDPTSAEEPANPASPINQIVAEAPLSPVQESANNSGPKSIPLEKELDSAQRQIGADAVNILKKDLQPNDEQPIVKAKPPAKRKERTASKNPLDAIFQAQTELHQMTSFPGTKGEAVGPQAQANPGVPTASNTRPIPGQSHTDPLTQTYNPEAWRAVEDPAGYTGPTRTNVTYNTWLLGDIKLLIRCGYRGIHNPYRSAHVKYLEIQPKLEYQLHFGVEQITYSEAARAWIALHIRENCELARVRINPLTSEIVRVDTIDKTQVAPQMSGFNALQATNVLYGILHKLKQLDVGHYVLSHTTGNPHAQIKVTTPSKQGVYDLHLAYMQLYEQDKHRKNSLVPWIPVDPNVRMAYHLKFGRVPCTFDPKDLKNIKREKPKKKGKNKGKKKRGGKKKKAAVINRKL